MRCNDCTQHVLDGHSVFALLVELCCAHFVFASAWVAGQFGWATQTNAILLQNGFSHFFQCCHVFLLITLTNGHQCYVSVTNNEEVHFSHEVFVVGINVNAWLNMPYFDLIINITTFIYIYIYMLIFAVVKQFSTFYLQWNLPRTWNLKF